MSSEWCHSPHARGVGVAQLDLAAVGGERAAAEVAGVDEVGQRPARRVGAEALAERGVGALDDAVEAVRAMPIGASSKAWRKRSRLCIASARASSLSRQCTTLTMPSAPMKSAWTPAQRHGWAMASGWL